MRQYGVITILVLMLVAVGCSEQSDLDSLQLSEVQEVMLSRSLDFGTVNEAVLGTFKVPAIVDIFVSAIHSASKIEGVLDIRRPDYDVTLHTKDEVHSIHLWLETEADGGMYTYVSDTSTGYTLTKEAAAGLKKLIQNLPYTPEQAELNGDVVDVHGKLINMDKWEAFLANVQGGTMDQVQLTRYTVEGDPIFYNLSYDSHSQSIVYTYDTTMDAFGSPRRVTAFCERIESKSVEQGTAYTIVGCDNVNIDSTILVRPMEND